VHFGQLMPASVPFCTRTFNKPVGTRQPIGEWLSDITVFFHGINFMTTDRNVGSKTARAVTLVARAYNVRSSRGPSVAIFPLRIFAICCFHKHKIL